MALKQLSSQRGTYGEINNGAHRTAASIVGMPSLVRHLGFWDVSRRSSKGGDPRLYDTRRRNGYREYIGKLDEHISASGGELAPEPAGPPRPTEHQVDTDAATLLRFRWHGMRTTVRLEFHVEYVALTSIVDLSFDNDGPCNCGKPCCPRSEAKAKLDALKQLFECQRAGDRLHKTISDYLQLEIWGQYEEEVINASKDGAPILGERFGEVFLDSRGIVTGTESFDNEQKPTGGKHGMPTKHKLRPAFALRGPRTRMREDMMHGKPAPQWASDTIRRLWPFIECDAELAEYEYTVTGFLEGRVLFVTALGPQASRNRGASVGELQEEAAGDPIRYFLHAYPDDEWQLGRLVDRINTLGTMRLAATMEIGGLKKAGELMDGLAKEIKQAAEAIQAAIKEKTPRSPVRKAAKAVQAPMRDKGKEERQTTSTTTIEKATKLMGVIGESYQDINNEVTHDIWYRLERSQYYLDQFRKDCRSLRETRVEGFQTYSEFVMRRMSSIFSYIQYLTSRMDNIETSNSSLERQYSWLKISTVTGEIGLVAESMKDQDAEIEKIQEFGEFALIGALIPYYVSYSVNHIVGFENPEAAYVWLCITAICVLIASVRIFWKRKDAAAWNRLNWLIAVFVAYLLLLGAGLYIFGFPVPEPQH